MPAEKEYPVCRTCGSTKVLFDAFAEWDHEKQELVLQNTFDDAVCEGKCDGAECSVDWIKGDPPEEDEDVGEDEEE